MKITFAVAFTVCLVVTASSAQEPSVTQALLWNRPDGEDAIIQGLQDLGVMSVHPVIVPDETGRRGANDHFGWPVAAQRGDTIVVLFARQPWHYPGADPTRAADSQTSQMVIVRSTDRGQTWSDQVDLRQFMQGEPTVKPAGMRVLDFVSDGRLFAVGSYGLFISADGGQTWQHHPDAFNDLWPDDVKVVNFGPNLIEHPKFGLLLTGHASKIKGGVFYPEMWYWRSTDGGQTFQRFGVPYSGIPNSNGEPSGMVFGNRLLFIGRSHDEENYEPATDTFRYSQLLSDENDLKLKTQFTNMRTSDAGEELVDLTVRDGFPEKKASTWGKWSQDTAAIILNPVTGRIEAVLTNRSGRGGALVSDHTRQSLNLWSIDPQALIDGSNQWRFEGTLLERKLLDAPKLLDGMHPAAATVDEKLGIQRIFIYVGYYKGPAGIFEVRRTLDTSKLADAIDQVRGVEAKQEPTSEQAATVPNATASWLIHHEKQFDGDDFLDLSSAVNRLRSMSTGSISARFKTSSTDRQAIFAASDRTRPSTEVNLYVENGKLRYVMRDGDVVGSLGFRADVAVSDGQWHWAMVTVNEKQEAVLYLDGRIIDRSRVPFCKDLPGNLNAAGIGRNIDDSGPQWFWTGTLSDIQLWNQALTPQQVEAMSAKP